MWFVLSQGMLGLPYHLYISTIFLYDPLMMPVKQNILYERGEVLSKAQKSTQI